LASGAITISGDKDYAVRALIIAACVVIVAVGIKAAAHVLSIILISLLMTYIILPVPQWLMRRFRIPKGLAITITVISVILMYSAITLALVEAGLEMKHKLPIYEEHMRSVLGHVTGFLAAHGVHVGVASVESWYSSDKVIGFAKDVLPGAIGLFSDRIMIALLSLFFLIEIAESEKAEVGPVARKLLYFGGDVRRFIIISAQTGGINALINLALLSALRVDFAFVWCFLYFFLHFIPNFGFAFSVIPPTLVALLMLGWKRALLVLGGLILSEMLGDYVIKPLLMAKELHISILDITLSLMVWGYLLGPAGAILAIPLTLVLRRYLQQPPPNKENALPAASG
jgi:AI-2 transport protein TqsA